MFVGHGYKAGAAAALKSNYRLMTSSMPCLPRFRQKVYRAETSGSSRFSLPCWVASGLHRAAVPHRTLTFVRVLRK